MKNKKNLSTDNNNSNKTNKQKHLHNLYLPLFSFLTLAGHRFVSTPSHHSTVDQTFVNETGSKVCFEQTHRDLKHQKKHSTHFEYCG